VVHWRMDEACWESVKDEVRDSSGNGNHGTAYGGATTRAGGVLGNAGEFCWDSSSPRQHVRKSDLTDLKDNVTGAVSFWVWWKKNFAVAESVFSIYDQGIGTNSSFNVTVTTDGDLTVSLSTDGNSRLYAVARGALGFGEWHHVVLSQDGVALKAYVDGELWQDVVFGGISPSPDPGLWFKALLTDAVSEPIRGWQTGLAA